MDSWFKVTSHVMTGAQLRPVTLKDGRKPLTTDQYHRNSDKPQNLSVDAGGPSLVAVVGNLRHLVPMVESHMVDLR
uniref:Uncharacterized protein n=1 Tax=Physcomitrium patens TaxID=3218 RepID=A0A2K1KHH6_PHYPA|nr:hypothetical protein PHYPA_009617 [Physcomitrium patens]